MAVLGLRLVEFVAVMLLGTTVSIRFGFLIHRLLPAPLPLQADLLSLPQPLCEAAPGTLRRLELIFLRRERSPAAARGLVDLPRARESSALLWHLPRRVPRALGKVAVSRRSVGRSWFLELS